MSISAKTVKILPAQVDQTLVKLGFDLKTARTNKGESLRTFAARMEVSVPTLRRMENGDASVGISVYATAIWLLGYLDRLNQLMD